MDTDFIPKGSMSTYYQPFSNKEQKRKSKEEQVETEKNLDILQQILARLDERIALYQSLESIPEDTITKPELLAQTIHANKMTVENLKQERGVISDIIDAAQ